MCLIVILGSVSNIFNDKKFQVLKILKTLLKIIIKHTLRNLTTISLAVQMYEHLTGFYFNAKINTPHVPPPQKRKKQRLAIHTLHVELHAFKGYSIIETRVAYGQFLIIYPPSKSTTNVKAKKVTSHDWRVKTVNKAPRYLVYKQSHGRNH